MSIPTIKSLRISIPIVRFGIVVFGVTSIVWVNCVWPLLWRQQRLADLVAHIVAGEIYKPEISESITAATVHAQNLAEGGISLSKIAIVRLRGAETAIAAGDGERANSSLRDLHRDVAHALAYVPSDAFLWLILFWAENTRNGFKEENIRLLRMSYLRGRHEGWIAVRRNRFALALFPLLPTDLAEAVMSEFVEMVRSQVFAQAAADNFAGLVPPIRKEIVARLVTLSEHERNYFADLLDARNLGMEMGIKRPDFPRR